MNMPHRSSSEQQLVDQFVREADAVTPAFSEALHERIMQRLASAAPLPAAPARPAGLAPRSMLRIAATIILIAGIWWAISPPPPRTIPAAPTFSLPTPPQVLSTTVGPMQQAMAGLEEQRLAYLDEDATNLAQFMLDQIPGNAER